VAGPAKGRDQLADDMGNRRRSDRLDHPGPGQLYPRVPGVRDGTKVTLVSSTQAKVTCSLLGGGKPVLSNQTGLPFSRTASGKSALRVSAACWRWRTGERGPGSRLPAGLPGSRVTACPGPAAGEVAKGALVSPAQATVTCSIAVSGEPVSSQTDVAVYSGGTWKAGAASFCGRLAAGTAGQLRRCGLACRPGFVAVPADSRAHCG
jgi:hypothetical protein